MTTLLRCTVGLLIGLSMTTAVAAPASAELGPKATLIVTNVEARIAKATLTLRTNEGILRANAAEAFPRE